MIKKLTIYMFTSLFVMSLVSSVVAKITDVMMYDYKLLQDDWDHSVASCPSGSSETHPDANEHKTCTQFKDISGLTCYKDCKCQSDYIDVNNDGVCVSKDCSAYPHDECSLAYTEITRCPANSLKCRYDSCNYGFTLKDGKCVCSGDGVIQKENTCTCDVANGWGGTPGGCMYDGCDDIAPCSRLLCTNDYSTTVSSCDTGYTLDCKGYSGGKECCKCTCTADATCTEANYPLTKCPDNAECTPPCTPGCGDNTPRYVITSCKDGYELSGNACVAKQEPYGFQCCVAQYISTWGKQMQTSPIGRYISNVDKYEGCMSGGNRYEISSPKWTNRYASMCGPLECYYYTADNYNTLKGWLSNASPTVNVWSMVVGICGDIETDEDIFIENDKLMVHLIPCPVEYGITPKSYAISSSTSIELEFATVSVSMNYRAPIMTLHNDVSLYNSLIKADKIYLKGKVFFNNVKIEPLYSDHVDIYIGSNDEGYNCYKNTYIYEDSGYIDTDLEAEYCAPMIGFYSSKPNYQYRKRDDDYPEYYYWTGTIDPTYSNVWGTPDKPVIFHKETSNTLDGIMFSKSLEDVTIYGYNGDSSPIFSEFKFYNYNPNGHYVEPLTKTLRLNLKNYASNTAAPLFRRFQTFEPHPDYGFNVELNIYKDFIPSSTDDTKVASAANEIKTNSYLSSEETCSLGTASSYIHARDYDTTDCGPSSCEGAGLVPEEEYNDSYVTYTPVTTACDGKMGTDTEKCYKVSYRYCMWGEGEDPDPDEIAYYGDCSSEISYYAVDPDAYHYACAEITNEDPFTTCETLRDRYINDLGFDDVGPTLNYSTVDYQTDVYGNTNSSGSKCLVCNFSGL